MVRSFSTLGGGIGVRLTGFGTGTLMASEAIAHLELAGILPSLVFAILDDTETVTFMAIIEPTELTVELRPVGIAEILDLVTGSDQFSFARWSNHDLPFVMLIER